MCTDINCIQRLKRDKFAILLFILNGFLSTTLHANELNAHSWNYSSPDMYTIHQGNMIVYCEANPNRCPSGLKRKYRSNRGLDGTSLYDPSATSTANHTSVVITGDSNSLTLDTEQSSENDSISSEQSGDAVIDHENVMNIDY